MESEEIRECDEKWLDEMLGTSKPEPDNFAAWNNNSLLMIKSIAEGVFHCDLGFSMKVMERHQKAALEILSRFKAWYENTPPKEKERQIKAANDAFVNEMNARMSARQRLFDLKVGETVIYRGKSVKVTKRPYLDGQYIGDDSKPQNYYIQLDGIGEAVMDDCTAIDAN